MNLEKYDPEIRSLIDTCMELQKKRDPKALTSLDTLRKIAEKKNDPALTGFAYFYLANTHYRMELNYHHFRSYLVKAITALQNTDEHALLTRAYNYVGVDASNNGCFDVSYHYFMSAQRIAEPLDDPYLKGIVMLNLGQLYARLGNAHLARQTIRLSLQLAEGREDDLYYYHNLVSGHYLDGVLSIRLHDYNGAKKADAAIRILEQLHPGESLMGAEVVIYFLRAEIALIENERDRFDRYIDAVFETFASSDWMFDFMEDITQFSMFLLEQNETAAVRKILDRIHDAVIKTDNIRQMLMVTEVEISYYDLVGDEQNLHFHLRRQHDLEHRRQSEQNRIYFLSIGLIDSMDEVMKQRARAEAVADEDIPLTRDQNDSLTGLPNRLACGPWLERAFERARGKGQFFGFAVINIDRFSTYNEVYGKKAGNICLQRIALELRVIAYQHGIFCARYGGDIFVAIIENMKNPEIMKILRSFNDKVMELDGAQETMESAARISVTIGICNAPADHSATLSDFVMEAHGALTEARKRRAKNTSCEAIVMKKLPK